MQLTITALLVLCTSTAVGIQPTWRTARIGGGGRVTGILMHAKPPYNTYIRTDVGGAYRFNSSSNSWVQLLDWISRQLATWYGVESIAVHPARPSSFYVALGEYADDVGEPSGAIMASNDAGATFTMLLAPSPFKPPPNYEVYMGSNQQLRWCGERLAVSAAWPPVLLFGSRRNGLWRSPDGGKTWAQVQDATLRDAVNRGTNFVDDTDSSDSEPVGITSVLFHPTKTKLAFAAVYNQGVFRSLDAGISWEQLQCNSQACSSPAAFPANIGLTGASPQGLTQDGGSTSGGGSAAAAAAGASRPSRVCRLSLTPKTNTLLATARDQGLFQLPSAGVISANTALWQDITPSADPDSKFCAVDAVALPRAAGSPVMERLGVATCEVEDDGGGTRQLCQVFVAEMTAGTGTKGASTSTAQPHAVVWRQQKQHDIAVDAAWWDAYMLAGPFNTGLLLSRKPGAAASQIWLTNNFGVLRGTVSSSNKATDFKQFTRDLEEVCAFDVKVLPAAGGGNVLSAVADVDGFTHRSGAMGSAPIKWCSDGVQECSYFQETHSLAYCYSNASVVARVGHVYWTEPSSSGLAISIDGGTTWPASGMRKLSNWINTVQSGGLLVGAPYRVAISATNCSNMVVLVSSGGPGTALKNLVTFDGGVSFQPVSGLPVVPRTRWYRDQPLVADTVAQGVFYFFYNASGQLFYSKDQGRSFSPARSTLRPPMGEWEFVTVKARPGVAGEVWVGYPWDDGNGSLFRITGVGTNQEMKATIPGVTQVATFAFGAPFTAAAAQRSTAAVQGSTVEGEAARGSAVQGSTIDPAATSADPAASSVPALYIAGVVGDAYTDGIWVSQDLGDSWLPFNEPAKNVTVGKTPIAMDASVDVPGKVVIGTNGRGIWFSI